MTACIVIDYLGQCLTDGKKSSIVTWLAVHEMQALCFARGVILESFLLKLLSSEDYYLLALGLYGDSYHFLTL